MAKPRAVFLCHDDWHLYRFRLPVMRALAGRGWEIVVVCPTGKYTDSFAAEGMRHVSYSVERRSINPLKELRVVLSLARILAELKPDLLHTFTIKPNIYGALAARWAGIPARVATVAGMGSFYLEPAPTTFFRRMLDAVYRAAMRGVHRVILLNTDDRHDMLALGICNERQAVVIPESVDAQVFTPAPRPEGGPVVITMSARLIRHKGVDEFLQAAETLKAKWGERILVQLAGDEDHGNRWPIDSAKLADCERRGIVKRLGFVKDVAALLRGTDIYTLPSYYREGTPISVLEAMAAGLAVVTTDSVGCRETVVHQQSGLLVPVRDSTALAAALDTLVGDAGLRRRFGVAARERVIAVFDGSKAVDAHLALYQELTRIAAN